MGTQPNTGHINQRNPLQPAHLWLVPKIAALKRRWAYAKGFSQIRPGLK